MDGENAPVQAAPPPLTDVPTRALVDEFHRRKLSDLQLFDDAALAMELSRRHQGALIILEREPKPTLSLLDFYMGGGISRCLGLCDRTRARLMRLAKRQDDRNCNDAAEPDDGAGSGDIK